MTHPDEDIEQEDNEEVFEDPVKDPKDEKIAEVPPEFEEPNEEGEDDPFDTEDEDE